VQYRTIFLSDIHLGARACSVDRVMDFLRNNKADTYYLVGDIVDGFKLRKRWYWPKQHDQVVHFLLNKAKSGCKVILVPGNHDAVLRDYFGTHFSGLEICQDAEFSSQSGERFWVTHGDQFDEQHTHNVLLSFVGNCGYSLINICNWIANRFRQSSGKPPSALLRWCILRIDRAQAYVRSFEHALAQEAADKGYDGVICGHIHYPNDRMIDGTHYINTGDWIENCTSLVETVTGELQLLNRSNARASQTANANTITSDDQSSQCTQQSAEVA